MPKRKTASRSRNLSRVSSKQTVTPSYDTQMIIVIILLLLAYPLGLIFMWAWMRTWPNWVKIVISLPLIIAILFIMIVFYFVGNIIRNTHYYNDAYQRRNEQMQNNYQNGDSNQMYISPSPSNNY